MNLSDFNHVRRLDSGRKGVLAAAALVTTLASGTVAGAPIAPCNVRLAVELTPDVPNPRDAGFLSSLVGNNPAYQLIFERQGDGSVIVVDLIGPGPDYQCQSVIETMRKDGRVVSVDLQ